MRQELFARVFSKGPVRQPGGQLAAQGRRNLRAAAIASALLLSSSPLLFQAASAQESDNIKPAATSEPTALYITICLWSQHRPAPSCREVSLTPGAAGPLFASMQACQDGQDQAFGKWMAQAGPAFGFTAMAGDGYRLEKQRCGAVAQTPPGATTLD